MARLPILPAVALALLLHGAGSAETLRVGPEFQLSPATVRSQSVAALLAGGEILALWPEGEYGVSGRLVAAVTDGGTPGEPVVLRSTIFQVLYPAAASSNARTFVTWFELEQRELSFHLLGMILDGEGNPLTDVIPVVSGGLLPNGQDYPAAVVWTGRAFAVAVTNGEGRLLIRRFTEAGVPLDSSAIPVTYVVREGPPGIYAPQLAPAAASRGDEALLAWQDGSRFVGCYILCPPSPPAAQVNAVRLDADGLVVDATPLRVSPRPWSLRPAVTWNDGRFLVAWSEQGANPEDGSLSLGVTVLEGFVAVGAAGALVPISSRFVDDVAVAPFHEGFVVAWSDGRRALRDELLDVYVLTIDRSGAVTSEALPVSAGSGTQSNSSLVVWHERFVAVYERSSGGALDSTARWIVGRSLAALALRSRGVRR